MQLFKPNDAILILPKFAHLYPSNSGIVARVKLNPYRPMFNTYTVQFPDGSTDTLMEFQIIEDLPAYKTMVAELAFDSYSNSQTAAAIHTRGAASARRVILQTGQFDVDIKIQITKSQTAITGQVLERHASTIFKNLQIRLMKEATTLSTATSDNQGVFKFNALPPGSFNILIVIPDYSMRLLGAFSI